ncbi:unnamed protein product [Cyprideis torosa]|uniref:Uncharacterized protein n=1 Tax=Cyprideis torosa TaxID=163714 RepID=A0A7R8ZJB0_9CRUS|nr:unnamed protein product [Cyprideis torosa]CAG0888182.1 unnamed protein product [Cyprideis torosa]
MTVVTVSMEAPVEKSSPSTPLKHLVRPNSEPVRVVSPVPAPGRILISTGGESPESSPDVASERPPLMVTGTPGAGRRLAHTYPKSTPKKRLSTHADGTPFMAVPLPLSRQSSGSIQRLSLIGISNCHVHVTEPLFSKEVTLRPRHRTGSSNALGSTPTPRRPLQPRIPLSTSMQHLYDAVCRVIDIDEELDFQNASPLASPSTPAPPEPPVDPPSSPEKAEDRLPKLTSNQPTEVLTSGEKREQKGPPSPAPDAKKKRLWVSEKLARLKRSLTFLRTTSEGFILRHYSASARRAGDRRHPQSRFHKGAPQRLSIKGPMTLPRDPTSRKSHPAPQPTDIHPSHPPNHPSNDTPLNEPLLQTVLDPKLPPPVPPRPKRRGRPRPVEVS